MYDIKYDASYEKAMYVFSLIFGLGFVVTGIYFGSFAYFFSFLGLIIILIGIAGLHTVKEALVRCACGNHKGRGGLYDSGGGFPADQYYGYRAAAFPGMGAVPCYWKADVRDHDDSDQQSGSALCYRNSRSPGQAG